MKTLLRVCSMFGSAVSRLDGDRSDLAVEIMRLAISQPQLDAQFREQERARVRLGGDVVSMVAPLLEGVGQKKPLCLGGTHCSAR